jgi:DNA-binding NarL/FixJ family response regulator
MGWTRLRKARELLPDLILLDIGLPTLNGLEAARQIRVLSPRSKIIFLTENHDPDVAAEALQTGQGFVVKTDAEKELLAAIEAVIEGKRFVSHRLLNDGHAFDFERWQAAD